MGYYKINIQGIVQGVGFRPFLFNLAKRHGLTGSVINKGNVGVELLVYSPDDNTIDSFISNIRSEKPSIAYIEKIDVHILTKDEIVILEKEQFELLRIKPSERGIGPSVTSPPDIAICSNCIKEMSDPKNERFFQYPFIACAVCGPRFTTIKELPYDRERTTMDEFPFCSNSDDSCGKDYTTPQNRRFHAQTYSCTHCGPNYFFVSNPNFKSPSQNEMSSDNIQAILADKKWVSDHAYKSIQLASEYISSGKVIAVMGIGGVHIVGDARNSQVIKNIRERKRKRKTKPFAIMVRDTKVAKKYAIISDSEKKILESFRRSIVLLPKKEGILPDSISPGLHNIGVMLPYTGVHFLLFQLLGDIPLLFTSGNYSDLPMAISPDDVIHQLNQIVDGYLLHNRAIYQRTDDSVLRVQENKTKIIRRSRGYVPEYLSLPFDTKIKGTIAVGPELSSTGLVTRDYRLFPTQHIGNVDNLETYEFLKNAINHMQSLLNLKNSDIELISMDLHPQFQSTKLAKRLKEEIDIPNAISVQHHFAHAGSLMVDNRIKKNTPVVIATLDGVGYGIDGKVWGGEIISGTYQEMNRTHHLSYIPMVGGDLCVTYPARMVMGFLLNSYSVVEALEIAEKMRLSYMLNGGNTELQSLISSFKLGENIAYSSSCGRLLDTISNILGLCNRKYYRGEPAMRLEGVAYQGNPNRYDFFTDVIGSMKNNVIPSEKMTQEIIELMQFEQPPIKVLRDIAASSLYSIGKIFGNISFQEAFTHKIPNIGLSGGVTYNDLVSKGFYDVIRDLSEKNKFRIHALHHHNVPPGDAGISVGQAAIAISKLS